MPTEPESGDDLQFEIAEPVIPVRAFSREAAHGMCGLRSADYRQLFFRRQQNCLSQLCACSSGSAQGRRSARILKSLLFGSLAGLLGAVIWFAIRKLLHFEVGLVAIVVGFMVGVGVRKGSGNRGGRAYQVMAVLLTYFSISMNYLPDIAKEVIDHAHETFVKSSFDYTGQCNIICDSTLDQSNHGPLVAAIQQVLHASPSGGKDGDRCGDFGCVSYGVVAGCTVSRRSAKRHWSVDHRVCTLGSVEN